MSRSVTEKGSELSEMQGSVECAEVRGWVRRESPDIGIERDEGRKGRTIRKVSKVSFLKLSMGSYGILV